MTDEQGTGDDLAVVLAGSMPTLAEGLDTDAVTERLADTLGCALAAYSASPGVLSRIRHTSDSPGPATLWDGSGSATVEHAALVNGVAVRCLDLNDTHIGRGIVHPSDCIPALVALAEAHSRSWEDLQVAVGLAYELVCRLNETADLRQGGWEGATLTPLGVAFGGSHLLGLGVDATAIALRLAALEAPALRVTRSGPLSDWKSVSSPRAAVRGLFALAMARAGVDAPPATFTDPDGFVARVTGPIAPDLAGPNRVAGTIVKRFPAQILIQAPLSLAIDLQSEVPAKSDQISKVVISTSRRAVDLVGSDVRPENGASADHNLRFCVAAALVTGSFNTDTIESGLASPDVAALFELIDVVEDEEATRLYPKELRASLTIETNYGSRMSRTTEQARAVPRSDKLAASTLSTWPWQIAGAPELPG